MSQELKANLKLINENFNTLKKTYNVDKIGIFGSVSKGRQNQKSDIDILVDFSQPVGFLKFIELEEELTNLLNKKVDLVTRNGLKSAIKKQILKEVVYA